MSQEISPDPIPGGDQPLDGPIPGGDRPLQSVGPQHAPGPGSTMTPPVVKAEDGLTESDKDDIREMAQEMWGDGPAAEADPSEPQELGDTEEPTLEEGIGEEPPDVWEDEPVQDDDLSTPDDGTGGEAVDEGAIPVTFEEVDDLLFEIERDGEKREVSLGQLLRDEVPREQYLQDKQRVHEAEERATARERAASQKMQEYEAMEDLGLTPREFVVTYLNTQVPNQTVSQKLIEFVEQAFDDPEAMYNDQTVHGRANQIRQVRQQQVQAQQAAQQQKVARVRADMAEISTKFLEGGQLTDAQIDALYEKMQTMQSQRGYDFVAPLEAFQIYRDEIMAGQKPQQRTIGKSRKAINRRIRRNRSNVPSAGVGPDGKRRSEPTLEDLAEDAAAEIRASFG